MSLADPVASTIVPLVSLLAGPVESPVLAAAPVLERYSTQQSKTIVSMRLRLQTSDLLYSISYNLFRHSQSTASSIDTNLFAVPPVAAPKSVVAGPVASATAIITRSYYSIAGHVASRPSIATSVVGPPASILACHALVSLDL